MKLVEKCSCNASFKVEVSQNPENAKWAMKQLNDWRDNHKHDFEPMPEEHDAPTVVESYSTNERALPFGFTREEIGDVS